MDENRTNDIQTSDEDVALATVERKFDIEAALTQNTASYCSFKPSTPEDSANLFNGLNNPKFKIVDEIGQTIVVRDVFCEIVDISVKGADGKPTGELKSCPRVVLFDKAGNGHQAISIGIYKSLERLFKVFGKPTWDSGIPLVVKQVSTSPTNKMLTLEVGRASK